MRPNVLASGLMVVIGASLGGLFAAAAAADSGRRVLVLERDVLPDQPGPRPGVPQDLQPHILLHSGLLAAERLLPGLRADLIAAGAVPLDTGDLAWLGEQGWAPMGLKAFEIVSLTRPRFEQVVRQRVAALPGVEIRGGWTASGLSRNAGQWVVHSGTDRSEPADLVIDASGRSSRLPTWLPAAGITAPRTTEIDAKAGYATRMYGGRSQFPEVTGIVVVATPDRPAGAVVVPVEDDRWLVLALGNGEHRPPRDAAGFTEFLAGLRDPAPAQLATNCTPLGDVAVHRQTGNRRRHYENDRHWPDGLLVMGDAFCCFNPVYGQGIAVAAREALLLHQALARGLRPGDTRRLLHRFSATVELPWAIATGQDVRFPDSNGSLTRSQVLANRWTTELARLGVHGNVRATMTMSRIYHLMAPARTLLHPALILAVLRARISGVGPAAPRPAQLEALNRQSA